MIPFPHPIDENITREMLEQHFGDEANYQIVPGNDEAGASFPDGSAAAFCSNYAVQVCRELKCEIYGFMSEDNPHSEIARDCGGHDFALVNGRFIVDQWAKEWEQCTETAVLDLQNPVEKELINRLYGPPEVWLEMRNESLEDLANGVRRRMKP